ncbi:hypothetical protein SAMN06265365_1226 [Tistlia consotensis]|uniref:Uncharacterized protein n=1 Tax=Tistlia consotensis USBA 355 TaxID=560819 RepID=A0A1Y6CFJ1_9PROT|nr:DUF1176 domain-containing protein [Tistlia consotensis]SMF62333.1 hypothetical protein SAMN05428998_1246 [Tistlia consotensis USBA 355]SNR94558.1 hypothetical protein SAMN06265365_1226 [Tistlia consotensis]
MRNGLSALLGLALLLLPAVGRAMELPPALQQGDLAAWSERVDWPEGCQPEAMPPSPLKVARLDGNDWLLLAACESYAYQLRYRAWRVRGDDAGILTALPLLFPFRIVWQDQATLAWRPELVGLADVDGDSLTLTTKARGLGDCGERIVWDLSQPLPVALDYRSQPDCPDAPSEADADPNNWPAVAGTWLKAHRPADRSWQAAQTLARLQADSPQLAWLAGSLVAAEAGCDGATDRWVLGLDDGQEPPEISLFAAASGERIGPFPVDSERQDGLCGIDATLSVETGQRCPVLKIDDGRCDALRISRDPDQLRWTVERN